MGCQISSISSSERRRVIQASHTSQSLVHVKTLPDFQELKSFFFEKVLKDCSKITVPKNIMPTVCLDDNAFPLIAYSMQNVGATNSEIKLPIISASLVDGGKVVVFSQLSFISDEILGKDDNLQLTKNVFKWLLNGKSRKLPMPMIGFDPEDIENTIKTLEPLGYNIVEGSFEDDLTSSQIIILSSTIVFSSDSVIESLMDFVNNGGSVIVFYVHTGEINFSDMSINKFLNICNLAFSFICLNEEDDQPLESQPVQSIFSYVKDINLIPLINNFKNLLQSDVIDSMSLDGVVANLRYYILVCDYETFKDKIIDLYDASWDYLKRTNYIKNNLICPEVLQGIITVLLVQIIIKLPVSMIKESPTLERFPGKTGDVTLTDYEIDFDLAGELWISTGLWLPPGVIGTIEIEEPLPYVTVHIGSHSDILYNKPQPWIRWPNVTTVAPLISKKVEVASSFGGIAYILLNDSQKELHSKIKFHNFCHYPIVDISSKERWELTKDINVPWGELMSKNVIFTLPTDYIKKIEGIIPIIFDKFDLIAEEISSYMGYQMVGPYRYVFDVEDFEGMRDGYPITLPLNEIDKVLYSFEQPTVELFEAISSMALVSMKEGFDEELEGAIASIAALDVMKKLFNIENITEYCNNNTYTFKELWKVNVESEGKAIRKALKNAFIVEEEGYEEKNKGAFLMELSMVTEKRVCIP